MKFHSFFLILLISVFANGQESQKKIKPNFNQWSIELNGGLNNPVRKFTPGYSSAPANFGDLNFGVRYMFNAYAGLDLKIGFDRFQDDKKSPDFATNMGRISVNGIVNLGNVLQFHQWTDRLGLLFHAGVGGGNFVDKGFPLFSKTIDKVGAVTIGLTPQVKLNDKWSLNLDVAIVGLGRMHHMFDYNSSNYNGSGKTSGFNGQFFTGTVGVAYYLGKKEKHADWSPTISVNKSDIDSLNAEMQRMRSGMNDDDNDGVPNYLDKEPNTTAGNAVNARGETDPNVTDSDKDGMPDANDACPDEKGPFSTNGCPDKDGDGVEDKKDKCPEVKGSIENEGCPGSASGSGSKINLSSASENVYFETASSALSTKQKAKLDILAKDLQSNPSYNLFINGHADNRGGTAYNEQLSVQRAKMAKDYLTKKGVDPSRIQTFGFGESKPADSNETVSGRAKNRRVEFQVGN